MGDEVIEAMAHAICPHIKMWSDETSGFHMPECLRCISLVDDLGGGRAGTQGCRMMADEAAQAALSALAEKGYVVVPKEVTPAMQKAYFDVIDSNLRRVETDAGFGRHDNMRLAYRAMLSASQPPS